MRFFKPLWFSFCLGCALLCVGCVHVKNKSPSPAQENTSSGSEKEIRLEFNNGTLGELIALLESACGAHIECAPELKRRTLSDSQLAYTYPNAANAMYSLQQGLVREDVYLVHLPHKGPKAYVMLDKNQLDASADAEVFALNELYYSAQYHPSGGAYCFMGATSFDLFKRRAMQIE